MFRFRLLGNEFDAASWQARAGCTQPWRAETLKAIHSDKAPSLKFMLVDADSGKRI
ncbi:MAG: hypothetical protein OXD01_01600 [Gammaproteobacteria bacterium]|nr:hypothetical protein [Gammaproteobacteria bacterium]